MTKDFGCYMRAGKVLTAHSILKQDLWHGKEVEGGFTRLVGAPNFFGMEGLYSLGQPSIHGVESSLGVLGESKIVWINLREEAVVYINGEPFVLRDVSRPFENISSFRGMSDEGVERLERRLKMDVVAEAQSNGGFICVHEERSSESVARSFVKMDTVMTTKEVFFLMMSKGYSVVYSRIPFPSYGFVSETNHLNKLIYVVEQNADENPVFVFNSSGGRRRSMFSLVMAALVMMKRGLSTKDVSGKEDRDVEPWDVCVGGEGGADDGVLEDVMKKAPELVGFLGKWQGVENELCQVLRLCMRGRYRVLNNIGGVVDKGSKKCVDHLIDKFGKVEDLRKEVLYKCIGSLGTKDGDDESILALEKYVTLILFAEYLRHSQAHGEMDFVSWMGSKTIFSNLFKYLKDRRNRNNIFFPVNIIASGPDPKTPSRSMVLGRYTVLIRFEGRKECKSNGRIQTAELPVQRAEESVWVNLRAEPCLFIGGEMFVLKEVMDLSKNPTHLRGISPKEIEALEERLKTSVSAELQETGRVVAYRQVCGDIEELDVSCHGDDVLTTREHFEVLGYSRQEYFRVPVADNNPFEMRTFDQLVEVCKGSGRRSIVVLSDGGGRRSSYAAMVIDLALGISQGVRVEPIKFRPIHTIVRVLKHGRESLHRASFVHGKYVGDSINVLSFESFREKDVVVGVKMFFLMVCFCSYLGDGRGRTFEEAMRSRAEIMGVYEGICPENKDEMVLSKEAGVVGNHEHIKRRDGKVLGPMTVLKSDYFIGSDMYTMDQPVEGAKNLRFVESGEVLFVGLAMPTHLGILNVLDRIRRMRGGGEVRAMWFCLREEPVVYIDDSPYVLRYVTSLAENIETKGISYDVVECVEEELVQDVLLETRGTEVLLHGEVMVEGRIHTIGRFHRTQKVESVKSFFESFNFKYFRITVTDEQAPSPEVFDLFHRVVGAVGDYNTLFFNCQMGRGRTTTAMVISHLVRHAPCFDFEGLLALPAKYKVISKLMQALPNSERSKVLADSAIDRFDHLENLRECIDRCVPGNFRVQKRGRDFLARYFYIIVFCEFLIQRRAETFRGFLERCPEITSLAGEMEVLGLETVQ